jgi:hypothetical protein
MEKEIADKVPLLTEEGEYIPGMDHAIPANCSLTLFQEYAKHEEISLMNARIRLMHFEFQSPEPQLIHRRHRLLCLRADVS